MRVEVEDSGTFTSLDDCESICVLSKLDCRDNYACIEVEDGSGTFSSLDDCESICVPPPSWKCVDDFCIEVLGYGQFSSLEDCELSCNVKNLGNVI